MIRPSIRRTLHQDQQFETVFTDTPIARLPIDNLMNFCHDDTRHPEQSSESASAEKYSDRIGKRLTGPSPGFWTAPIQYTELQSLCDYEIKPDSRLIDKERTRNTVVSPSAHTQAECAPLKPFDSSNVCLTTLPFGRLVPVGCRSPGCRRYRCF